MRHSHKIAKHVFLKRAGLQELSFPASPIPHDDFCSPPPKFINYRSNTAKAPQTNTVWREPDHGLAVRVPALKQAKTARGHSFHRDTVVYHESELEYRVNAVLKTYRGLARLISQYPKVEYVDKDGVSREHTFDYYIELDDGTRIAIAVKYERKRQEMLDLLDRICANGIIGVAKGGKRVPGVADAVALVTNATATQEIFENAFFILTSRNHHDDGECAAVMDIVQKLPESFRFGNLLTNCGPRADRRTAIWRLIDLGHLEPISVGRIDELSWLRAA